MKFLSILEAIHDAGVIHRNICRGSLCATEAGHAYIVGLNFAKNSESQAWRASDIADLHQRLGIPDDDDHDVEDEEMAEPEPASGSGNPRRSLRIRAMQQTD
jgi:hypothetical protein